MDRKRPGVNMYFIAVVLPAPLNEKIHVYKKQMQERYGCTVGLKSPAHITLAAPFWMEEGKESALRQDLQNLAQQVASFPLITNDFSAFPPRTIFVAVGESIALQALKKTTDAFFRHSAYGMKFENRPFHPHITIATRDLHKKDFAEAWPSFQKEIFREPFNATGLSLLKHNGRSWDVVFTAPFAAPLPTDAATQP